jgi:hypothetical protein
LGTSAADLPKAGFRALDPVALADVTTAENIRANYRVRATGPSATSETRRGDVSAPQPSWEGRITRHGGPWRRLEVIACLNRQSA